MRTGLSPQFKINFGAEFVKDIFILVLVYSYFEVLSNTILEHNIIKMHALVISLLMITCLTTFHLFIKCTQIQTQSHAHTPYQCADKDELCLRQSFFYLNAFRTFLRKIKWNIWNDKKDESCFIVWMKETRQDIEFIAK